MPLDDEAVWLCSRTDFGDLVTLIGLRRRGRNRSKQKKALELAQASGFLIPPARYVEGQDIRFKDVIFTVVFKPAAAVVEHGSGLLKGRSWICADWRGLESALKIWAGRIAMLLQHFVLGVGEGLFGLATSRGVIAWSAHHRLRMMNPHGSGASACTFVTNIEGHIKSAAERFLTGCGWRGIFMIEMLRDESDKLWFLEFNGRSWGSMALARRAGFEYPAWAVQIALARVSNLKSPKRWITFWCAVISAVKSCT